ncbi:MAG TPA: energy transducer TonB [Pyrinomonadaceae bacterium]|nr:energy transducer TonB [Pyrinomonadaceae bacterium]
MFNNLIESTSHAREFKRRGSFLLFTTATYLVLFVVTGVVSIYAYDAHLEAQNTELELLTFVPVPPPEAAPPVRNDPVRPASPSDRVPRLPTRTDMISSTSDPTRVPPTTGITASDVPPWRPGAVISSINYDPPAPPASVHGIRGGTGTTPVVNIPDDPPPAPAPAPVGPKVLRVSSTVLQGKAVFLPKPTYPAMARQIRLQGTVIVQVLIDEQGKVVSAKAVSGHPILVPGAQQAAMQARFAPTKLGDQPVKVSGVITYNFVTQ